MENYSKKEDIFQTHENCWFVNSDLSSTGIYNLINPNPNINILVTFVNKNIAGHTFITFWDWFKKSNNTETQN